MDRYIDLTDVLVLARLIFFEASSNGSVFI